MYNQRLLDTHGEEMCRNAWDNAVRVGLRHSIWRKMWNAINEKDGKSYLKRVEFIVLKNTDYADAGEIVGFTSPSPSYFNIGKGIYKSISEIQDMVGYGEIYPKILISTIDECNDTKRLFQLNKTEFNFEF